MVPDLGDAILQQELDDDQLLMAVRSDENTLVLAPPGSGKTRVLVNAAAHRVRHARELVGYDYVRVMCLTFGTDAATEMRQRLQRRPLSVAAGRMWVGNYHALAAYLLRRYGHLLGWPRDAGLVPPPTNEVVVSEAIEDLGIRNLRAVDAARAISAMKGRRTVSGDAETLKLLRERYDGLLAKRHLRDFDDLIIHARELLDGYPEIQNIIHEAYPFVFIDELQDTNLLQLDLLSLLIGDGTRVFAVADDDQMIYGWRDAHPQNISEFVDRFGVVELPLYGNYRCPPEIVSAANRIIALNVRRRSALMESRVEDHCGDVTIVAAQTMSEGDIIAKEIENALKDGTPLAEIVVLAPHRFKFDEIVAPLDRSGIPHVILGTGKFRSTPFVRLLGLALRCVAGGEIVPSDIDELSHTETAELYADKIRVAARKASVGHPRGLINRLLAALDLGSFSQPRRDAESVRLLARMAKKALGDDSPPTPAQLAETMIRDWDRLERTALQAEDAVKMMTSFSAKGTEYEMVILPFLNHGTVPYAPRGAEIDWQEARRLFYVALTRSKRRVVLVYDAAKPKSALLEEVEPAATQVYSR